MKRRTLSFALLCAPFALILTATGPAIADDHAFINLPKAWSAIVNDTAPQASEKPKTDWSREIEERRSHVIPALEIVGFDGLLNLVNRSYSDDYKSNFSTISRNLRSSWRADNDPFKTNQLGHPYQGSMYHGFARSAGLSYWEAMSYTFAGSAFWEIAGERVPPSINDQINTGIGGSFLGEVLFRLSNLVLEHDSVPHFWREAGAAAVSPATGFNRLAFHDRFRTVFPSREPVYFSRLQIGFSGSALNKAGTSTTKLKTKEAMVDYSMDYGLPGNPGYTYSRAFDYFSFQATASSANGAENLMTRGLLAGRDYEVGAKYRGVWGLYGSYDYIAPQIFRVSSTALSLGTTAQSWLSDSIALQGTALLGAGYAAVGTTRSTTNNDYHYGVAPQGLLALRLIYGTRASIDLTGREYFVSSVGSAARGGHDNIARLDAALTLRVYHQHGISIRYLLNQRDAFYPATGNSSQTRGTIGVFYTFLGHDKFGAVEWR